MPDWKVFYRDDHYRDAQSTHTSKEAAIVQALHLERRRHCRIQIIVGQNGELIDRETFEREHLKKPLRYLRHPRLGGWPNEQIERALKPKGRVFTSSTTSTGPS